MNLLKKSMLLGGCVAALTLGATLTMAQRGDPSQFRDRMIESYHTRLEITNDADWTAIQPMITKVMDAQREVMSSRIGGMFGGARGGRRGGGEGGGSSDSSSSTNSDRPRRGNPFEPSAAVTALQKAIEDKAPAADLKTKMAAVRAEVKEREAKLDAAQEELRGVLSTRQEAIAVAGGLLK